MRKRAFTLLELLIVITIIAIFTGLSIPIFDKAKEHALGKEAIASLRLISAAEKIYRLESNPTSYYGSLNIADINTNLSLSLPSGPSRYWDYSITADATTFGATASRVGLNGYLECVYTINQSQEEPVPNAACP